MIKDERSLVKGHLVTTLPKVTKEYVVSFEMRIDTIDTGKFSANIIHFNNGNRGKENKGVRIPTVYIKNTDATLFVCSDINDNPNYCHIVSSDRVSARGEWITVEISQLRVDSTYYWSIVINKQQQIKIVNTKPAEFQNVKVYASNPWNNALKGAIRNFTFQSKRSG